MCILAKYGASLQYGFGSECDSASVVSGSEHLTDTNVIGLSDGSYSAQEHCRVGMDSGDLQGSQSYSLGKSSMLSTFCSGCCCCICCCCCSVVVVAFVVVVVRVVVVRLLLLHLL
jgi:hypothetical protein